MKTINKIRTRFAPSPTGLLHIGNVRTALYAYLFAKHDKGDFILRIEDTDRKRSEAKYEKDITYGLKWLGLEYDEIYKQSERLEIYRKHAKDLLEKGAAYYCFCTEERLEKLRRQQQEKKLPPRYDEHCRNLSKEEIEKKLKNKTPYVIRMKMPRNRVVEINDLVRGKVEFNTNLLDDQVLLKSDGFPTYHLACVVDDHLMKITHVVRAEEWLSSTPKHILLYEAFEWTPPKFAHIPMLLSPDRKKLSKRHGAVSLSDYRKQGYLKEVILNFMLLLGWNPGSKKEIFSFKEMIKEFSLKRVHKAGAVFDINRLDWFNGYYIRQKDLDEFANLCIPHLEKAKLIHKIGENKFEIIDTKEKVYKDFIKKAVALEQKRIKKLSEVSNFLKFFFSGKLNYEKSLLFWKDMKDKDIRNSLEISYKKLEEIDKDGFSAKNIEAILKKAVEENNLTNGELLWPLRVALTSSDRSPGPFEVAEALGKEKSLQRIKEAQKKIL
ncbi:glutamate--tRNA ligase [bacterium (Candidatus Torokbacteria) CG_4_10_14_0_2_um_filter_35_8]|nr:MAG: glutamate--tRNA ligase [bacterium (Candidatus Torokbacteria) CG_4_10_14_0_2_um_filter_35_8]